MNNQDWLILHDLIKAATGRFVGRFYRLRDDIISTAKLAGIESIQKRGGAAGNEGLIVRDMQNAVRYLVEHSAPVYIPRTSYRKVEYLPLFEDEIGSSRSYPCGEDDFQTLLGLIAQDGIDMSIIELRDAGYSQKEVAGELGISPSAVNQRIKRMKERWTSIVRNAGNPMMPLASNS